MPWFRYLSFLLLSSVLGAQQLTFATYQGGSGTETTAGIARDSAGNVYLAGSTDSTDFPVLSTAGGGFVVKLDSNGTRQAYFMLPGVAVNAIAVDASNNVVIAGTMPAGTLPPSTGAYSTPKGTGFIAKFSSQGALAWYTYLGGSTYDAATAIALDRSGNIYLAGNTDSVDFPKAGKQVPDCHIGGRPFLAELDPNGTKLLLTAGLSGIGYDQVFAMAFDAAHSLVYLAGDAASEVFFATPGAAQTNFAGGDADSFVARIDLTLQPQLVVSCVLNAASLMAGNTSCFPTGAVAPGEIVSLFGVGLGPTPAAQLQSTSAGTVATALGGTQVLFDGVPAPMLYAADGQINAVVPYGIKTPLTRMTVQSGALSVGPIPMPVVAAVPAIFSYDGSGSGQAVALNSDSTYNPVATPAVRGTYITFYACGAGLMSTSSDGAVTPLTSPWPAPQQPATVTIRGVDAQVLYAGAAPGYVSGLLQINVVVPTGIDFGDHLPLRLNIGNYSSQLDISIVGK
jgi:uncharacterized protein (TIGR03437 family)